jgi:hypothetical protein
MVSKRGGDSGFGMSAVFAADFIARNSEGENARSLRLPQEGCSRRPFTGKRAGHRSG